MTVFKQKQLSPFQKWRQRLKQRDWQFVIEAVESAETLNTIQAIAFFEQLFFEIHYLHCSKRFYIKRHLNRFKRLHQKTG